MDNQSTPTVPTASPEYRTLGRKTFVIFLLDRISVGFVFLFVAVLLFVLGTQKQLASVALLGNLQGYATLGGWVALGIAVIAFAIALLVSWLIYINYKFCIAEESLKIKRGVLDKEEIAIPYRQIQDVDIERDLSYQVFGMSRLVILTAGHEDEKGETSDEAEGILPALDKAEAEWLQQELLKRTDVQKVIEEKI